MEHRLIRKLHQFRFVFAALVALSIALIAVNHVQAQDRNIVTVYLDDTEMIVPTKAVTVGEFIERLDVTLHDNDLVEPSADSIITGESFNINIFRARPVTVVDGDKKHTVSSPFQSPKRIAESAGLKVYDEDEFELERVDDILSAGTIGLRMHVDRATPMKLNLFGDEIAIRSQATTVGDVLNEKGIELAEGESVRPALDSSIKKDSRILVLRAGTDVINAEQPIAFEEETILDSSLPIGQRVIQTPGVDGKKVVTYQLELENDKEVGRTEIKSVVLEEPKTQVVKVGTKAVDVSGSKEDWLASAGVAQSDWGFADHIISHESGWGYLKSNYAGSGAYGLCQALPGSKMSSAGADWATNPVTQLKWCDGYAKGRYGSWSAAYGFWINNHWW